MNDELQFAGGAANAVQREAASDIDEIGSFERTF